MLFMVFGNDDIHGLFAERTKAINLVFLYGFCVTGTMDEVSTSIDRTQLVVRMKSCPIIVVRL